MIKIQGLAYAAVAHGSALVKTTQKYCRDKLKASRKNKCRKLKEAEVQVTESGNSHLVTSEAESRNLVCT